MTTMMTTLQLPQMGRTTSTAAIKPFKQQSTFQASSGNNLKEEKWQMGKQHDCRWWTMDDWQRMMEDEEQTTDNRQQTMDDGQQRNNKKECGRKGRKTAVVMAKMVSLGNVMLQQWTLQAGWPQQEEEGGNHEGKGATSMGDEYMTNNDKTMMGTHNNERFRWEGGDNIYYDGGGGGQLEERQGKGATTACVASS
jgi:hypothetical protein